ncbi:MULTISPECIES: chemotaxis protein CheX [Pseudothermotoga]|uniref:CheC domain protein n=1 Tax=Pseudothermotoga lettingae (strain ATCC BAA-301 / DSM 14385 / NBRC 107922 / TMO) TaxID=416591 RepID=A8F3J3_PSELT|nr:MULTISPECIES: chemotaxis protein CheX [Pseudothermotoga]ABV32727.1 CheC domain protein [Pseudothermotoga lettingae TMO]KUK20654.1 MAG: CheC domain protein [Pseudothermotoga lettingae]MDK2885266.1 chemotaxis protein CheX [Pseudothermotoga sp.]GLI48280.1 CheY-P phosphatase CheX [Pseudothermotoga lettingae TMO]HBJ81114.1 chemotaxis protein CheX [Pseudothermotoga sp.]
MDARVINALIAAIVNTLEVLIGEKPTVGKPGVLKEIKPKFDLITLIGFVGGVEGNLIYSFNPDTALKIVSKMMNMPYENLDELAMSAIGELGNMIAGALAMNLEKIGCKIVISPPTVVTGRELKISVEGLTLQLPVSVASDDDVETILSVKGSVKCGKT